MNTPPDRKLGFSTIFLRGACFITELKTGRQYSLEVTSLIKLYQRKETSEWITLPLELPEMKTGFIPSYGNASNHQTFFLVYGEVCCVKVNNPNSYLLEEI